MGLFTVFGLVLVFSCCEACLLPTRPRLPRLFPGSVWQRNVSGFNATSTSMSQIQAAYQMMKGSTIGAPNPTPLVPGPPSVTLQVLSVVNPPIFGARANGTISVPQASYDGVVGPNNLTILEPILRHVHPSFPFGFMALVNNQTEMDFVQVTTYKVLEYSQGGGYIGPILSAATSSSFATAGSGSGIPDSVLPSGVPLLAGVLLPEDLDRGSIDHVLAITLPQFRNQNQYYSQGTDFRPSDYFPPCINSEFRGSSWRQMALAAGQVLRLKPNGTLVFVNNSLINEDLFAPVTKMVLKAFRTYGVMPVRLGSTMSVLSESVTTGFVMMNASQAQALAGSRYQIAPTESGTNLWYQLLLIIAQEIAVIPLASPKKFTPVNTLIIDANLQEISIETPNWEVVVGAPGTSDIGEGFIPGYNYLGSIDVVLIILACTVMLPLAVWFTVSIANS